MIDDKNPDAPETDPDNGDVSAPVPAVSRFALVVWAFLILFALYACIGMAVALFSNHVDPSIVSVPEMAAVDVLPEPVKTDLNAIIPFPMEEDQKEQKQEEAPLNLGTVPEPEKTDIPPPSAPEPVKTDSPAQSALDPEPSFQAAPRPKIAVVIDDMGLNHVNSRRMAALRAPLTLAYLPYADNLPRQTAAARQSGHELWVHMPMEPSDMDDNNPGPNALLTTNSAAENMRRLNENLAKFDGYVGINNHMGSRFTRSADALAPVMAEIKKRGLWFLDSKTIGSSVASDVAVRTGVAAVDRDIFLDNVATVPAVKAQLRALESVARRNGYAVAIGHPHDATVAALKTWLSDVQSRGFDVVPLSEIIARRFPVADIPLHALYRPEDTIEPAAGIDVGAVNGVIPPFSVR